MARTWCWCGSGAGQPLDAWMAIRASGHQLCHTESLRRPSPLPRAPVRCFAGGSRCSGRRSVPSAEAVRECGNALRVFSVAIRQASAILESPRQAPEAPAAKLAMIAAAMSKQFLHSIIVPLPVDEDRSPTLGTDRPKGSAFTHCAVGGPGSPKHDSGLRVSGPLFHRCVRLIRPTPHSHSHLAVHRCGGGQVLLCVGFVLGAAKRACRGRWQ